MASSSGDDMRVYREIMRELRVKDPLGGRTDADIEYARASRAYAEKKKALSDAVRGVQSGDKRIQ